MTLYNVGDAPTTVTNVVLFGYRNRLHRWLRRTEDKVATVNHALAQAITLSTLLRSASLGE